MVRLVRPRPRALLALLVGTIVLAACGGGGGDREGEAVTVTTGADGPAAVTIEAHDVYFDIERITAPAGDLDVTLVEEGNQVHTFVVAGVDDFKLEVSSGRSQDRGVVTLQPGQYEYYCDVPGHRGQGMTGTLVVQ